MKKNLRESIIHGTTEYHFALYHIKSPRNPFHISLHWHDEAELIYIEKGILFLHIGEQSYEGKPGDIFFVNPGEIHDMYFEDSNTVYVTMLFAPNTLVFLEMDYVNTNYLLPLTDGKTCFLTSVRDFSCYSAILQDIREILDLNAKQPTAYQFRTKILLLDILYQMYQANAVAFHSIDLSEHCFQHKILEYIKSEYLNDICLSQIARQFSMSPKYFSRFFHHTFHITLTQYINQLRMEHAASLLTNTDLSVTEIALQSGFSSCSYFNKKFQAAFHCSPNQYRKQLNHPSSVPD